MMTEIYLIRHGQTEWNIEKRYQGSGDSPLTKMGTEQAIALANHLESTNFDAFYSSPAGRAQTTAKIILGNRNQNIEIINDFQEINLGNWEGRLYEDTKSENPELYNAFWKSPDLFTPQIGESFEDVGKRTFPALKKLAEKNIGKRVLLVSHAVAIKSILNIITGLPLNRFWENKLFQTSVSILRYDQEDFSIIQYGSTVHLEN